MSSSELGVPFLVVTMLAYMNAQTTEIPICKPPAMRCSMFKRSVCEWSESGDPVWACRGFFETVNNEPKLSQPKPAAEAQKATEPDVVLGTYEYKIPSANKVASQDESIEYVTYTYPIATKKNKISGAQEDSKSEVKFGTYTLPAASSPLKVEPGSDVTIGTYTIPSGSRTSAAAGTAKNDTLSKVEIGSNVQIKTYTLPSVSKKESLVPSGGDVHIETFTMELPTKSPVSKLQSDSAVQIGTNTQPVDDSSPSEVPPAMPYYGNVPSSESKSPSHETDPEVQIGAIPLPAASRKIDDEKHDDSEVKPEIYIYQLPSNENILNSSWESASNLGLDTHGSKGSDNSSLSSHADSGPKVLLETHDASPDTRTYVGAASGISSAASQADTEPLNTGDSAYVASSGAQSQGDDGSNGERGVSPMTASKGSLVLYPDNSADKTAVPTVTDSVGNDQTHGTAKLNEVYPVQRSLTGDDIPGGATRQGYQTGDNVDLAYHRTGVSPSGFNGGNVATYPYQYNQGLSDQQYSPQANSYTGTGTGNPYPTYAAGELGHGGSYSNLGPYSSTGSLTAFNPPGNTPYFNDENSLGGYRGGVADVSHTSKASPMGSVGSLYYPNSDSLGQQQSSLASSGSDSSQAQQNYGSGNQNPSFGYPYYGYGGFNSLEQGSSQSSPSSSGNGVYYWPSSWTPLMGMGGVGYGNWLLGHNNPLVNPGLNSIDQTQSVLPSTNYYGSGTLNPGSSSSVSNSLSGSSPVYYLVPYSLASRTAGTPSTYQPCSFCKKLRSIFGGDDICDDLEPIILEFFNKILEVFRKRLS